MHFEQNRLRKNGQRRRLADFLPGRSRSGRRLTQKTQAAARAAARRLRADRRVLENGRLITSRINRRRPEVLAPPPPVGRLQRSGGCCSLHNAASIPNPITENLAWRVRRLDNAAGVCVCVGLSLLSINAATHCRTPLLILALTQYAARNDDPPPAPSPFLSFLRLPPHGRRDGDPSAALSHPLAQLRKREVIWLARTC